MPINDIRVQQRSQQSKAIQSRREAEGVVRIGDRDSVTGRYQVIEPDGGVDVGGVKVFNSQEQYGDRVLPFRRLDGTIALDSEKGSKARTPPAFPKCPGYLASQVFNCEEPKPVKKDGKIWILFLYNNRLYVGGHKQAPELIYNPIPEGINADTAFNALPVNVQDNIRDATNDSQIWGDDQGWEAAYAVRHPIPLVKFAIEGEVRDSPSYVRTGNTLTSSPVFRRLGKGIYTRFDRVFTLGDNYGESWKNTIADFDGAPKGSGSDQSSSELTTSGGLNVRNSSRSIVETYPAPHSSKSERLITQSSESANGPSSQSVIWSNSCQIVYRDRFQVLFSRFNSQYITANNPSAGTFSSSYSATLDYIVSDGRKDTVLFSIASLPREQNQYTIRPNTGFRPKFNFPFVTDLGDFADGDGQRDLTKYIHLDAQREYRVRVYDANSKISLIDGAFEEVTLSAWGIPPGARVLDTASWVQP